MSFSNEARASLDHLTELPSGNFRFVALDVETANAEAGSICQIGLACVQQNNEVQSFSMLVNPRGTFEPFNVQLHGISADMVKDAPEFPDALKQILPLLTAHHLIQHSSFDQKAIASACRAHRLPTPDLRWDDSVKIARRAWPELKGNGGHGLANLKKVLGLEFLHHDAGEDARAAAQVVLLAEDRLGVPFADLMTPAPKSRSKTNPKREANPDGPFYGAIAVISGQLNMPRERAANFAAKLGMAVRPRVTRHTTHLIVGDDFMPLFTDKGADAAAVNDHIQVLAEEEFKALLRAAGQNV
ncbi:exonuclease domain-containing protein [uncultured Litoreibacter sp.]|uniref:exonuclease domain-containing protein n=1 Tax=uncultured Litoreibacter sp. TaxID=1392394 RepID=UPI002618C246|nr:exonuclease domain-containing protein [uncultured Litoreibacter sp.]